MRLAAHDFQHIVLIGLYHFIADFVGPFAQFRYHLLLYFRGFELDVGRLAAHKGRDR